MDSPDLQIKYQKLALEYSKLRAQNQVLKKAVIDEQGKTTHLKDNFKTCDQSLRKAEQEIDSLSFRNQQLTKRLSLLQDDLEIIKNKPRKGQTKSDTQSTNSILDNNVYAEELESKIQENARLHAELTDLEVVYKTKVSDLENNLEEATREVAKCVENVKSQEQILQHEIKRLESERVLQEVHAQQRESKISSLQNQLRFLNGSAEQRDDVQAQSKPLSNSRERLPVTLPVSLDEKTSKIPDGKIITNLLEPIKQFSSGFIEFFISYSAFLKQSSSLSSSQLKLADQLISEESTWQLLSQRYEEMAAGMSSDESIRLENLIGLDAFSKALANCASSLRKLLPVLSEKWLCFQDGQLDAPWRSTLGRVVSCLAAINPYVASLAAHSDGRVALTPLAVKKILNLLYERLTKLHGTSQEMLTAWELLNIEDKKQEEIIRKPLSTIENALNKINSIFSDKALPAASDGSSYSSSPSSGHSHSPGTPHLVSHPALALLGSPDAGGWSGTIQESIQLANSEASLTQQLAQATSRLSKLEEEREHWRLECQLLNHRLEKENKLSQKLKEELNASKDLEPEVDAAFADTHKNDPRCSTSIIGEVTVQGSCSAEEREKEIRNHFTNRCSQLYMQLTVCTSQAAIYQNECENLLRRLAISEESKSSAEQEVEKQRREKAQIQENLSTTSRNYEEQISTMSDHLADLNEKITQQADTIEQLKFDLKRKVKK